MKSIDKFMLLVEAQLFRLWKPGFHLYIYLFDIPVQILHNTPLQTKLMILLITEIKLL